MNIEIIKANENHLDGILVLLKQVLEIHEKLRPDLFIKNSTKYTKDELLCIINNENSPVFVATSNKNVVGHIFTKIEIPHSPNLKDHKTLYIDDLCVLDSMRGQNIGKKLFDFIKEFAKKNNFYNITLNVWEGNDNAKKFYQKQNMFIRETQMELILE